MGTLRDEAYEKLDYLSQLTEVVVGPQNELLAAIPDRVELTLEQVFKLMQPHWRNCSYSLYAERVVREVSNDSSHYRMVSDIVENFTFEVSPDFQFDMANRTMTGTIALVKRNHQIDEKRLLEMAIESAEREIRSYDWPAKRLKERAITILNTFESGSGNEWAAKLQGRVARQAHNAIVKTLREAIKDNKWRVRDNTVIVKMGKWINSYMSDTENDVGLVNLLKLKIMLDKDLPVYSIDEVKNVSNV